MLPKETRDPASLPEDRFPESAWDLVQAPGSFEQLPQKWISAVPDPALFFKVSIDYHCADFKLSPGEKDHLKGILAGAVTTPQNYFLLFIGGQLSGSINDLRNKLWDMEERPLRGHHEVTWGDVGDVYLFYTGFFPEIFERRGRGVLDYGYSIGESAYHMRAETLRNTHPGLSERHYGYGKHFRRMASAVTELKHKEQGVHPVLSAIKEALANREYRNIMANVENRTKPAHALMQSELKRIFH